MLLLFGDSVPNPVFYYDAVQGVIPSALTFARTSAGTYRGSDGLLKTAASGAARFEYNASGAFLGLLMEETRTNLNIRSEEFDNAAWTKGNTTVSANATTGPDGATTMDALLETTANAIHYILPAASKTVTANVNYTLSFFVKANGRTKFDMLIYGSGGAAGNQVIGSVDLTAVTNTGSVAGDGVLRGTSIVSWGNGIYRCSVTGIIDAASTTMNNEIDIKNDAGALTYAGDATKGLYIWGAQLERGGFPSSYIATTTASVTRAADQLSQTSGVTNYFNNTEGTIYVSFDVIGTLDSANNQFVVRFHESGAADNTHYISWNSPTANINGATRNGGVSQASINPITGASLNTVYKAAYAYKANDSGAAANGTLGTPDTSGTVPTAVDRLYIGWNSSASQLNGHIKSVAYYNRRLPDAQLRSITA